MANYIRIYVAAETPLAVFVQEIEQLLHLSAQRFQKSYIIRYELLEKQTAFIVTESFLENYGTFNFEDYCFCISILDRIEDPEEGNQWKQKRANDAFQALKATGKYRLLMTDDYDDKLGEFTPASQQPLSEYALKARDLPVRLKLFLASGQSLETIAHEMEHLLDRPIDVIPRDDKKYYTFQMLQTRYRLVQHEIEPPTRSYEAYPYIVHIESRVCRPGERRYWQYESAISLFQQLKETGRYKLALVGDMGDLHLEDQDRVFAEFVPDGLR